MAHSVDPDTAERDNRGRILRTNTSQFFITMASTPELTGTNTLFGRIVGDTIFNALKIGGYEIDSNERPLYPPKIKTVKIVVNPFEDIVPRITRGERIMQSRAKEERQKERAEEMAKLSRKKAKKNTKLLSFGGDEETGEEVGQRSKIKSSHDLLDDRSLLKEGESRRSGADKSHGDKGDGSDKSRHVDQTLQSDTKKVDKTDLSSIRRQHARNTDTEWVEVHQA